MSHGGVRRRCLLRWGRVFAPPADQLIVPLSKRSFLPLLLSPLPPLSPPPLLPPSGHGSGKGRERSRKHKSIISR